MLNFDPIVTVNLNVNASTSVSNVADVGLIIGTTESDIDVVSSYGSAAEMLEDGFETTDPEYVAVAKYFAVNPAPKSVLVATLGNNQTIDALIDAILEVTNKWYGVYLCGGTDTNIKALDTKLNAIDRGVQFYGLDSTPSSAAQTSSLFGYFYTNKSKRALGILTTTDTESDAAAIMGLAMGLAHVNADGCFALCYKTANGFAPVSMTQAQAEAIEAINGNVYITRGYDRNLIELGTTGSGLRYDEVLYMDLIKSDLQDTCVELMTRQSGKLPQTDATTTLYINAISTKLNEYVARGVLASNIWRGEAVGGLETGDAVENGFYVYADTYDNQTQSDREAHKAMPIAVCLCLSGSVESVVINVDVQR